MPNHTIQPPVAFDIDVAPLRSPSKKPESLETWAPAATALQVRPPLWVATASHRHSPLCPIAARIVAAERCRRGC